MQDALSMALVAAFLARDRDALARLGRGQGDASVREAVACLCDWLVSRQAQPEVVQPSLVTRIDRCLVAVRERHPALAVCLLSVAHHDACRAGRHEEAARMEAHAHDLGGLVADPTVRLLPYRMAQRRCLHTNDVAGRLRSVDTALRDLGLPAGDDRWLELVYNRALSAFACQRFDVFSDALRDLRPYADELEQRIGASLPALELRHHLAVDECHRALALLGDLPAIGAIAHDPLLPWRYETLLHVGRQAAIDELFRRCDEALVHDTARGEPAITLRWRLALMRIDRDLAGGCIEAARRRLDALRPVDLVGAQDMALFRVLLALAQRRAGEALSLLHGLDVTDTAPRYASLRLRAHLLRGEVRAAHACRDALERSGGRGALEHELRFAHELRADELARLWQAAPSASR